MDKSYNSYLQCTTCRIKPTGNLLSSFNKGKPLPVVKNQDGNVLFEDKTFPTENDKMHTLSTFETKQNQTNTPVQSGFQGQNIVNIIKRHRAK